MTDDIQAVVLAGGRSSRLGQDKALLTISGCTLLQLSVNKLYPLFGQVLIVGREPAPGFGNRAVFHSDLLAAEKSSLRGLYSALSRVTADYALITAVDMPFLRPALLQGMAGMIEPGDDIIIPRQGNYLQPLCAIYSRSCLPFIKQALDRGERKMRSFFGKVKVHYLPENKLRRFDPELISFFNINTPEDYKQARAIMGDIGS